MVKLNSLMSSSSANSYLYEFGSKKILVDIGASCKQICIRLNEIGINPTEIDAIFITHEHIDHIKGLKVFLNNSNCHLYITKEVYDFLGLEYQNKTFIKNGDEIKINELVISCFSSSHDAINPLFFKFSYLNKSYIHLLDTGYINHDLFKHLKGCHCYLIETNYDDKMIMSNKKYPFLTKKRIMSDQGHLSNAQASEYIKKLASSDTKYILYGHISENNNNFDLIEAEFIKISVENKIHLKKDQIVEISL